MHLKKKHIEIIYVSTIQCSVKVKTTCSIHLNSFRWHWMHVLSFLHYIPLVFIKDFGFSIHIQIVCKKCWRISMTVSHKTVTISIVLKLWLNCVWLFERLISGVSEIKQKMWYWYWIEQDANICLICKWMRIVKGNKIPIINSIVWLFFFPFFPHQLYTMLIYVYLFR